MEVLVVEVSQEPEHSGTKDLTKKHHKWGKVEDEDHPRQPVKEHHSTYGKTQKEKKMAAKMVRLVCTFQNAYSVYLHALKNKRDSY